MGVHQHCYKRDLSNKIPTQDWFCQRCSYLIKNNLKSNEITCFLCSHLKGVMVMVKNEQHGRSDWTHVTCVNWIKEIYFEELDESFVSDEDLVKID